MQLTSSAKGTVAFSVALAIAIAYCNTNTICMSEPRSALIPTFGRVFGPLINGSMVAPLSFVLIGVLVFGIWTSRHSAYALAFAVGVVSIVIYVFSGLSFLLAGSFASVFICAAVVLTAALVTGYAVNGWREPARMEAA